MHHHMKKKVKTPPPSHPLSGELLAASISWHMISTRIKSVSSSLSPLGILSLPVSQPVSVWTLDAGRLSYITACTAPWLWKLADGLQLT